MRHFDKAEIVLSKLRAENARDLSDDEIERCLSGCVAPNKMKAWAKEFRDLKILTDGDLHE